MTTMTKKEKRELITLNYNGRIANIYFTSGRFDDYMVGVDMPGADQPVYPKDEGYFGYFKGLTEKERKQTYDDFVEIYSLTTNRIDLKVCKKIADLSRQYKDSDDWKIRMSVIYYGMVAEELKENMILGKRMKRFGMHQTLIDGMPAKHAAEFSKKDNWIHGNIWKSKITGEEYPRTSNEKISILLDKLMKERGF